MGERFNPYAVSLYEAGVRPVCLEQQLLVTYVAAPILVIANQCDAGRRKLGFHANDPTA